MSNDIQTASKPTTIATRRDAICRYQRVYTGQQRLCNGKVDATKGKVACHLQNLTFNRRAEQVLTQ
jgi:hypothetical protein